MIGAYIKAIEQLPDRRFLTVVLYGIIGAIGALVLAWSTIGWALGQVAWEAIPLIGGVIAWLGTFANELGWLSFLIGAGGLTWVLFPATAVAVTSLMLDRICEAVESKHYPDLGPARSQPLFEVVFGALRFLGITALVNVLAFPLYLILILVFGSGAFLFLLVNGYLVGREFFELVAARWMRAEPARQLRKAYRGKIILFGVLSVFLMSIPFLNFIVPVLAAAAMVHLYQGLPKREEFERKDDPFAEKSAP